MTSGTRQDWGTLAVNSVVKVYKVYEGVDHRGAIARSFDDALGFITSIRAGKTPASTC